jgi:cell division protein FtsB
VFLIAVVLGLGILFFMIAGLYGKLDQLSKTVNALRAELRQQKASRDAEDAGTDA